jgi:hypothetical protein
MAAMPGRSRYIRSVLNITAVTTITLAAFITSIMLSTRRALPAVAELPSQYMPGSALPLTARCRWNGYGQGDIVPCQDRLSRSTVYIAYDVERKIIIRALVSASGQSVGEMILAWGRPTGIRRYSRSAEVQWGIRSIFVSTYPFEPNNRSSFIFYDLQPDSATTWTGFASKNH